MNMNFTEIGIFSYAEVDMLWECRIIFFLNSYINLGNPNYMDTSFSVY